MAIQCQTKNFTADVTAFEGTPLTLDEWLPLDAVNLNSVVVTLWDFDINVIGGEGPGGGVVGGENGGVVGPQ